MTIHFELWLAKSTSHVMHALMNTTRKSHITMRLLIGEVLSLSAVDSECNDRHEIAKKLQTLIWNKHACTDKTRDNLLLPSQPLKRPDNKSIAIQQVSNEKSLF